MARTKKMEGEGIRKNLRLNKGSERRINRIRANAELASDSDVVRTALREYVKIMDLQMSGAKFFYRMPDSGQEIPLDDLYETERELA